MAEKEDSEELSNPEDEFVQAVKEVTIFGKFPQGLDFGGKKLVLPHEWREDFGFFSPTGFSLYWGSQMTYAQFIIRCLSAIDENRDSRAYPQAADLMKKHFLAITPPDRKEDQGYRLLIYGAQQDSRLQDGGYRHVRFAEVVFLMPKDKASDFIQLVEEKDNGADIVERFIQKAAPDVMAGNKDQPGVHRVQASELVILDERFLTDLLTARDNVNLIARGFLDSVDKAVVKQYSQPVGFGKPNSR